MDPDTHSNTPSSDELLHTFRINIDQIPAVRVTLESRLDTITQRLWQLSDHARLGSDRVPVLSQLVKSAEDPDELLVLGRAITAAAPLLRTLSNTQRRLLFLETLEESPHWVAGQLGDFSADFPDDLGDLDPESAPDEDPQEP